MTTMRKKKERKKYIRKKADLTKRKKINLILKKFLIINIKMLDYFQLFNSNFFCF